LPVEEVKAMAKEKGYRWTHAIPDLSTPEGSELMSGYAYAMTGSQPGNAAIAAETEALLLGKQA
jgi:hypothetical protein